MPTLIPVLLAGGEGKRLYPLSSSSRPKQFLKLINNAEDTLFQASVKRALMVSDAKNIITVASKSCRKIIYSQLGEIHPDLKQNILLEPCGRNTTAAIALAAVHAANNFDDPILWIIPSDHNVINTDLLQKAIRKSVDAAKLGNIVTFGINPTREDSNYGYIIGGSPLKGHEHLHSVGAFIEKPKGEHLDWVTKQENCWWNSGMFVMSANKLFTDMKEKCRDTLESVVKAYRNGIRTKAGLLANKEQYDHIKPIAIDKIIMENSLNMVVYPVDIGWSDVGSWHSLWELSQQDGKGLPLDNFLNKIAKAA